MEQPMKEGWLVKQGMLIKSMRRRYFKLLASQKSITYAEDPCAFVRGTISLIGASLNPDERRLNKSFTFSIGVTTGRTYYCVAENDADRAAWVQAISYVIGQPMATAVAPTTTVAVSAPLYPAQAVSVQPAPYAAVSVAPPVAQVSMSAGPVVTTGASMSVGVSDQYGGGAAVSFGMPGVSVGVSGGYESHHHHHQHSNANMSVGVGVGMQGNVGVGVGVQGGVGVGMYGPSVGVGVGMQGAGVSFGMAAPVVVSTPVVAPVQTVVVQSGPGPRQTCVKCEGKGFFGDFGPVTEHDVLKKAPCSLCAGQSVIYGNFTKCGTCGGAGGQGAFGGCERFDTHYRGDCRACQGRGYVPA